MKFKVKQGFFVKVLIGTRGKTLQDENSTGNDSNSTYSETIYMYQTFTRLFVWMLKFKYVSTKTLLLKSVYKNVIWDL